MFKKLLFLTPVGILFAPAMVGAQGDVQGILRTIMNLLNTLVPIIMALAIIYFLWELVSYLSKQGDEGERKEHRQKMIFAIITLAVMVGVWGLVRVVLNTFQIQPGGSPLPTPGLPVAR